MYRFYTIHTLEYRNCFKKQSTILIMLSNEAIDLLWKLFRGKYFVKGHIAKDKLLRHYRNADMTAYKGAYQELKQGGYIRTFPHNGEHVQLNMKKLKEIKELLESRYDFF